LASVIINNWDIKTACTAICICEVVTFYKLACYNQTA